jgi:hypothetical protein
MNFKNEFKNNNNIVMHEKSDPFNKLNKTTNLTKTINFSPDKKDKNGKYTINFENELPQIDLITNL